MKKPHPFLDPSRFWPNSAYLILLSVAGAALFEIAKDIVKDNPVASAALAMGICLLLSFGVWIACRREFSEYRASLAITRILVEPKRALVSEALIALCSASGPDRRSSTPAFEAANYHRAALKHLWLITSLEGRATADWVNEQVKAWGVMTHAPIVLDDTLGIDAIKVRVESTRREAMEAFLIREEEIVCDFTAMPKPVTAGMILACVPPGCRLEYLRGQYDEHGRLIPGAPSIPVEIDIRYEIESQA